MGTAPTQQGNRLDRRKARTRAALIRAAQTLIAEGRTHVPILEITQAADVGLVKAWNPSANDGSEVFYGVAPRGDATAAGENKLIVAYTRNCRVWGEFINWNGATNDQIAAAVATAAKKNLIIA